MKNLTKALLIIFLLTLALTSCYRPTPEAATAPAETHTQAAAPPTPQDIPTPTSALGAESMPTLAPSIMIGAGEQALFAGDYDAARVLFEDTLASTADPETITESRYGLGRALYELAEYGLAERELESEWPSPAAAQTAQLPLLTAS